MLSPKVWLRVASALTVVHALTHTFGGVLGAVPPGEQQAAVAAMRLHSFLTMGVHRTYWDFHMGFGLGLSIMLFAESIVLWQMSSLVDTLGRSLRPILITFVGAYLMLALNSWRYFFLAAVAVEALIAVCLLFACVAASKAFSGNRRFITGITTGNGDAEVGKIHSAK